VTRRFSHGFKYRSGQHAQRLVSAGPFLAPNSRFGHEARVAPDVAHFEPTQSQCRSEMFAARLQFAAAEYVHS
jgi:hypothetical protein